MRAKRRKIVREKYVILRDNAKNNLRIREYAIIGKNPKKESPSMAGEDGFAFLCEEFYKAEVILDSISKGINALITALRTDNVFPVKNNAVKIAESVMALYDSSEDGSVELYFDDLDLLLTG